MKLLMGLLVVMSALFAELEYVDFDEAMVQAKKENKIVMVMLSKVGCPGCKYMEGTVFENEAIINTFEEDFIAVHIDIHEDEIPMNLKFIGTPTFHFINKDSKRVGRIDGTANELEFLKKLREFKKKK